jgi:hypothetical protein
LALKRIEAELKDIQKRIDEKMGVKESDTGLARPDMWDLMADKVSRSAVLSNSTMTDRLTIGQLTIATSRRTSPASRPMLQDHQSRIHQDWSRRDRDWGD